jgi:hypothetical protein
MWSGTEAADRTSFEPASQVKAAFGFKAMSESPQPKRKPQRANAGTNVSEV